MRRRPYNGPAMSSREGTAGLRARLARAAAPPRPCGVFPIATAYGRPYHGATMYGRPYNR